MNQSLDGTYEITPTERFVNYFEKAKQVYGQANECKRVTQKAIVKWYNESYNSSLSEASLSKYLKGVNEIPLDVYVNMKSLAGVEEVWLGANASRDEYNFSSDIKESLNFIKDEVDYMRTDRQLAEICGDSVFNIFQKLLEYCEYASENDYSMSLKKLKELQNVVYSVQNYIIEIKYDYVYGNAQVKKAYSISKTLTGSGHVTKKDVNEKIEIFNGLIQKCNVMINETAKCLYLQGKIRRESFTDIPKAEEKRILTGLNKFKKFG